MKLRATILFVLLVLSINIRTGEASYLLGQFSDSINYDGGTPNPASEASILLEIDTTSPSVYWLLGEDISWTSSGTVVFAPGTDPDWDGFVAALTNATDDILAWHLKAGGLLLFSSEEESKWFGTVPDFSGLTIEYLQLDVTYLDYSMDNLAADIVFSVYGVPEPGTLLLFGLGGLALIRRRR